MAHVVGGRGHRAFARCGPGLTRRTRRGSALCAAYHAWRAPSRAWGLLRAALVTGFGALAGSCGAHGLVKTSLGGTVLCLDPASIHSHIDAGDPASDAKRSEAIAQRLARSIRGTLARYHVPFRSKASCEGSDAYVYTLFVADWAHREARPVLDFAASLQVGRWPPPATGKATARLEGSRFDAFQANLLFPSDFTTPYYQVLPTANEEMARQLALAWLNDAEGVRASREKRWLIGLGVALEALVVLAGVRVWWRRRASRTALPSVPRS